MRETPRASTAARIARGHRLAEEEVELDSAEAGEDRDRKRSERGGIAPAAAGRLAVAPGPVAGEREHDRRRPERAERHHVDEEPAGEARRRAGDRACGERNADDRDEQQVWLGPEHPR